MASPRPTLAELARRLGVSTATVSLALRDHPRVSAPTRARVKALARRLHYTPDLVARSLATRRSGVLGLVVADIANSYFARLARRVEDAVRERGFDLVIASTDEDHRTEQRVLDMMLQRRVDGLALTSTAVSAAQIDDLEARGVPLVLIGRLPAGARAASVSVDNRHGGREATRHLLAHGRRRVAVIAGPRQLSDARGRLEGHLEALREHGLPADDDLVAEGDFSEKSGHDAMAALLRGRRSPDAVFVCNNLMLLGALRAIRASGRRVPEDIAVAGFDEVEWSDLVDPPLTMAEQPTDAMARIAVDRLVALVDGRADASPADVVPPVLRIRRSCGCGPADGTPDHHEGESR